MGSSASLTGSVVINNSTTIQNIITDEGAKALLSALVAVRTCKVTNFFLLSNFQLPEGKQVNELVWDDIEPFIADESFTGNNNVRNSYGSMDMRVYVSTQAPFEATYISTIPADKANNVTLGYNAAVLVLKGDETQSVDSSESGTYNPTGEEIVFAVALFQETYKDSASDYTVVWYVRVEQ